MPQNMKQVIAEKFMDMTQAKKIDKITVTDLVDSLSISRQTFYYHFKDIPDVIEWAVKFSFEKMLRKSLKAKTPEDALKVFIKAAHDSSYLFKKMGTSGEKRQQAEQIILSAVRTYLAELLKEKAPDLAFNTEDFSVIFDYCTYGMGGLLIENCGREDLDIDVLASKMLRLLMSAINEFCLK